MAVFSEEQLAFFIQHGYLVIKTSVPEAVHESIAVEAAELDESGQLGNNLLPFLPTLGKVLDSPELVGALQGILGEDYVLMPHRHCHVTEEGSKDQPFHRDSFFGFEQFRQTALPCEVMVNYYPQRVTGDMGPTGLLPGSQLALGTVLRGGMEFKPGSWGDALDEFLCTTDEPGLCVVMHYHLWHRATGRPWREINEAALSPPPRWMFKLQFRRTKVGSAIRNSRENPFLEVCRRASASGPDLLPISLECVRTEAARKWATLLAPAWAATWSALTGEPAAALSGLAQDFSGKLPLAASLGLELMPNVPETLAAGVAPDSLARLVAMFSSEDATVRLSAAHVVALGGACSLWSSDELLEALLPVLQAGADDCEDDGEDEAEEDELEQSDTAGGRWGDEEAEATVVWLGPKARPSRRIPRVLRARCLAAAALQLLRRPLGESSELATDFSAILTSIASNADEVDTIQPQSADWVLEVVLAVPAVLPSCPAVECLTPLLVLPSPRVQLHACIALHSVAIRAGLPFSGDFRAALVRAQTEDLLLRLATFWAKHWAAETQQKLLERLKRRRRGPAQISDQGGRYALAEALRCLAALGSKRIAEKAAVLAGGDPAVLCAGDETEWRRRFSRFVEREWKCPITSPHSPF